MNFLKLQTDLGDLTMDTSTVWAAWGVNNKKALNKALEQIYDTYKNYQKVKSTISTQKTVLNFTNKQASLPADFDTINIVSLWDFMTDSDIVGMSEWRYYDFEIKWQTGSKIMYLEWEETTLYISYIPVRVDLVNDADIPTLPVELHPCIVDFGYFWYNRMIRDNIEAANALQLAQSVIESKLATLW